MAQFPLEVPDNPKTSGKGNFLNLNHEDYNHFYDSTIPRCEGFIVDRPPHNSTYFQKQLEAVGNYYLNISSENLPIQPTSSPILIHLMMDIIPWWILWNSMLSLINC